MLETFDRPAGRIKAVYGRTKGLVARRRALAAKQYQHDSSSESSEEDSADDNDKDDDDDDDYDDEKENQNPSRTRSSPKKTMSTSGTRISPKKAMSTSKIKSLPLSIAISDSEEEEVVLPSRHRKHKSTTSIMARCSQDSLFDDNELRDVVVLIESSLRITEKPIEKKTKKIPVKSTKTEQAQLLAICGQECAENFSVFLNRLEQKSDCKRWRKIGEASYSEVYGLGLKKSVIKVIPLLRSKEEADSTLPEQSLFGDVHREVELSRALSSVADGFIKLQSAQVVQGKYPSRLLHARASKPSKEEEANISPEKFPSNQYYGALELCNGGEDLESIQDLTWKQACSIFCQVIEALSVAEKSHQFEHRDLHWGNVVIAHIEAKEECILLSKGNEMSILCDPLQSGVKATIIDYTLSRAKVGKTLIAYSFDDESLFKGQGDTQFDVYRQMKQETKGDWSGFYPHTNVLWLNYLASKLIDEKQIPNPKRRSQLCGKTNEELEYRNFIMQVKQLLTSKRHESASDLFTAISAISST